MESFLTLAICVLASIFLGSFIGLVLLCRHKSISKKTARYVKKLTRADFCRSDTELVKQDGGQHLAQLLNHKDTSKLSRRCLSVLNLCHRLKLDSNNLTPDDIHTIHHIIEVARSITQDSEEMMSSNEKEKMGLLESQTSLVLEVSRTLAAMEQQLLAFKEDAVGDNPDYKYLKTYQSATLI